MSVHAPGRARTATSSRPTGSEAHETDRLPESTGAWRRRRHQGAGRDAVHRRRHRRGQDSTSTRRPDVSPDLVALDSVTLLPHLRSATGGTRRAMGMQVLTTACTRVPRGADRSACRVV
ncbi:hypothetical protein HBB16_20345 [Pseudonocardia sp. MCCB 268]|nr:hypothetical protein [Pseudonocardia cytotoxica]